MAQRSLNAAFDAYNRFGNPGWTPADQLMEGRKFAKLMRDTRLASATDADIIFVKVKTKGAKKITFEQFESALGHVADKKGISLEEVVEKICRAGPPRNSGCQPEFVKLFDDKSTYTGVYARGGPTNVDCQRDLSTLCDRSPADVRGISRTFSRS